ncbi:MAG: hypothetical protein RXR41_03990 [Candidatus Marsarchaeota archaeon]
MESSGVLLNRKAKQKLNLSERGKGEVTYPFCGSTFDGDVASTAVVLEEGLCSGTQGI